jgi:hypothetical protein
MLPLLLGPKAGCYDDNNNPSKPKNKFLYAFATVHVIQHHIKQLFKWQIGIRKVEVRDYSFAQKKSQGFWTLTEHLCCNILENAFYCTELKHGQKKICEI